MTTPPLPPPPPPPVDPPPPPPPPPPPTDPTPPIPPLPGPVLPATGKPISLTGFAEVDGDFIEAVYASAEMVGRATWSAVGRQSPHSQGSTGMTGLLEMSAVARQKHEGYCDMTGTSSMAARLRQGFNRLGFSAMTAVAELRVEGIRDRPGLATLTAQTELVTFGDYIANRVRFENVSQLIVTPSIERAIRLIAQTKLYSLQDVYTGHPKRYRDGVWVGQASKLYRGPQRPGLPGLSPSLWRPAVMRIFRDGEWRKVR